MLLLDVDWHIDYCLGYKLLVCRVDLLRRKSKRALCGAMFPEGMAEHVWQPNNIHLSHAPSHLHA